MARTNNGSRSASLEYSERLKKAGIARSRGRIDTALNNAVAESLIATIKTELTRRRVQETRLDLDLALAVYIGFCYQRRQHRSLDGRRHSSSTSSTIRQCAQPSWNPSDRAHVEPETVRTEPTALRGIRATEAQLVVWPCPLTVYAEDAMLASSGSHSRHILVTGGAGFIGSHLVDHLLNQGRTVTVADDFDDYYNPAVKRANIAAALEDPRCRLIECDIEDGVGLAALIDDDIDAIVHLAGRPGVRPSIAEPERYFRTNTLGTVALLEFARARRVPQFVFASSSSVYGYSTELPWSEDAVMASPTSPYGASKLAAEAAGCVYARLHGIRFVALRLFTVHGPRQRPDLAIHKFARLMLAGEPIPFFGDGSTSRDYTFVGDTVAGIAAALDYDASEFEIINLGSDSPVSLSDLVARLSDALGVAPLLKRLPNQPGDLPATWANIRKARTLLGYEPSTTLDKGLEAFCEWMSSDRAAAKVHDGRESENTTDC